VPGASAGVESEAVMATVVPECPACRIRMAAGFVLDKAGNSAERVKWIEGQPEKRWSGYATSGRASYEVVAYRCPQCAWVIWFAPAASPAS
jgi:hypothetical protein